jgi:hypothetical protein
MQPQNLSPDSDRQRETIKELLKTFFDEDDAKTAQAEAWGFPGSLEEGALPPPGVFTFDKRFANKL